MRYRIEKISDLYLIQYYRKGWKYASGPFAYEGQKGYRGFTTYEAAYHSIVDHKLHGNYALAATKL